MPARSPNPRDWNIFSFWILTKRGSGYEFVFNLQRRSLSAPSSPSQPVFLCFSTYQWLFSVLIIATSSNTYPPHFQIYFLLNTTGQKRVKLLNFTLNKIGLRDIRGISLQVNTESLSFSWNKISIVKHKRVTKRSNIIFSNFISQSCLLYVLGTEDGKESN